MSSDLSVSKNIPTPVDEIEIKDEFRIETNDNEFNRVLGGGIVPGSITLLGGEPVSYTHLTLPTTAYV